MVEINNQRKAFDMLAWSEGPITDVRKPEIMVMTSLRRRAIYHYSDHPRKLVTLNPKLKSTGAGRYQLLSRWWDAYRKQLTRVTSLRKVRTLWHCSIKERGAYPLISVVDIRRQIDRCSNIWASLPGAGCRPLSPSRPTALSAKFKEGRKFGQRD